MTEKTKESSTKSINFPSQNDSSRAGFSFAMPMTQPTTTFAPVQPPRQTTNSTQRLASSLRTLESAAEKLNNLQELEKRCEERELKLDRREQRILERKKRITRILKRRKMEMNRIERMLKIKAGRLIQKRMTLRREKFEQACREDNFQKILKNMGNYCKRKRKDMGY